MLNKKLREVSEGRWGDKDLSWGGYLKNREGVFFEDRIIKTLDIIQKLGKNANYLDIGCSDGFLTRQFAENIGAENVFGLDTLDLKEAKSKKISAIRLDLNNLNFLPFKDEEFDVITCIETLEHALDTDTLVSEIYRILKKDGISIISVPRIDSLLSISLLVLGYQPQAIECSTRKRYGVINKESRISGHVSNFTKRALLEMLKQHNFQIEDYRESSIYSGWKLAQRASGRRDLIADLILKIFSWIPFKKDVCIVKVRRT